ncbi:MutS-related protein [Streptomyces noursei]|uniref:MutS-related protein n=1 Tax=Streptomyces noursei TaxID=1971 RepID=UPI0007C6E696|nr:hypothetical protein [Streptomyces noursei]
MKAHLLYPDRDFAWEAQLPADEADLRRDLDLDTLLDAMADGDPFVRDTACRVLLHPLTDTQAIVYRQQVLDDLLTHPEVLLDLYRLTGETLGGERGIWPDFLHNPSTTLFRAVRVMELVTQALHTLRNICDYHKADLCSPGLATLCHMIHTELDDSYFETTEEHLRRLKFKDGTLISAELGPGCKGTHYLLRRPPPRRTLRERWITGRTPTYTYRLPDRDENGARALAELRDRGLNLAADALARSGDHILGFFAMLRRELAFYVGCHHLHQHLTTKGEPLCVPRLLPPGRPALGCQGLYDACLSLRRTERLVGNDIRADDTQLVVITGANEGGKSTFLRSVGVAQLMAQCGMFTPATAFSTDLRDQVFTHFRREEDATMESGKLDEELARMSRLADQMTPDSMMLFNESFAATNEREGSELARQIINALLRAGIKIFLVTHQYDLAHSLHHQHGTKALFLRAERRPDGQRTFQLTPGAALPTSFGEDLYQLIFDTPLRTHPPGTQPGQEPDSTTTRRRRMATD